MPTRRMSVFCYFLFMNVLLFVSAQTSITDTTVGASTTSTAITLKASALETISTTSTTLSTTASLVVSSSPSPSSSVGPSSTVSTSATVSRPTLILTSSALTYDSSSISSSTSTMFSSPSSTSISGLTDDQKRLIIGLCVGVGGFLCILLVVIIVLVIVCRRRRRSKNARQSVLPLVVRQEKGTGSINPAFQTDDEETVVEAPELPNRPIKLADLLNHILDHQSDMTKYRTEFNLLPGNSVKKSSIGKKYPAKNRYINILPFDENRVILTAGKDCDYINASFIDGYTQKKAYIAAQGPMDSTMDDFWLMIWEQNSNRIVMVTKLFELEKAKCSMYWPAQDNVEMHYGPISVVMVKEEEGADYTTRTLQIKNGKESRTVYQFHFNTWPDQDVPDTCTTMLNYYHLVFKTDRDHPMTGPVVIHCSAGVGRTGTLIALDVLIQQAKEEGHIDTLKCIEKLRRQRGNMVQSTAQYVFLHHALLEFLLLGTVEMKNAEFKHLYAQMVQSEQGPPEGRLMQNQYNVLNSLKPQFSAFHYGTGKDEHNREKNRTSAMLPVENFVPFLKTTDDDSNTYINAVYVHGFRKQRMYIATQMPLTGTMIDFWRLVKDINCAAIVMLNDFENVSAEQYWPEDGRTLQVGNFEITNTGELTTDEICISNLTVVFTGKPASLMRSTYNTSTSPKSVKKHDSMQSVSPERQAESLYTNMPSNQPSSADSVFQVRHIRLRAWPAASPFPREKSTMLSLYNEVVLCQKKKPNGVVLAHCLYGAERAGLCCAMLNMMDEIKLECAVDVFNSVKRVRRTRPEFVSNIEQYAYLYELASTHLSSTEVADYSQQHNMDPVYSNMERI